jgi:glutathione peroxidase
MKRLCFPGLVAMLAIIGSAGIVNKTYGAPIEFYSIPIRSIDGKLDTLLEFKGKALLIVNTASQCGYTPQYSGLEKLYEKYRGRGFELLGFPSNDFGGQEPGSNQEIKLFCQGKYSVKFPLFAKAPVTGPSIQPVYRWLLKNAPSSEEIDWNFEKFLISPEGKVIARFKSGVTPESAELISAIEAALPAVKSGSR